MGGIGKSTNPKRNYKAIQNETQDEVPLSFDVESMTSVGNPLCHMPELPDQRIGHTMDGNMICGGALTMDSCLQYKDGKWSKFPWHLQHQRNFHSSWILPDGEIVLLGVFMELHSSQWLFCKLY